MINHAYLFRISNSDKNLRQSHIMRSKCQMKRLKCISELFQCLSLIHIYADAWRTLLMENAPALAKSMKISLDNFHWYAALHNEGHHPHIHMMVWSDDPKEGFLTKGGIAALRSKLTNAIFLSLIHIFHVQGCGRTVLQWAHQHHLQPLPRFRRQGNAECR